MRSGCQTGQLESRHERARRQVPQSRAGRGAARKSFPDPSRRFLGYIFPKNNGHRHVLIAVSILRPSQPVVTASRPRSFAVRQKRHFIDAIPHHKCSHNILANCLLPGKRPAHKQVRAVGFKRWTRHQAEVAAAFIQAHQRAALRSS